MRELHGDKVRLRLVPLGGGGLLSRLLRTPSLSGGALTNSATLPPLLAADDVLCALEARLHWSRFGL